MYNTLNKPTLSRTKLQSLSRLPINVIFTFIVALFCFTGVAAQQYMGNGCTDTTLLLYKKQCPDPYNPVCGCNGNTYRNVCDANNNGVISYTNGACGYIDIFFAPIPVLDVLHLNISLKKPDDVYFYIFDLYGKLRYFKIFNISNVDYPFIYDIDMTAFSLGPYILVAQSSGNIIRREFLKIPNY